MLKSNTYINTTIKNIYSIKNSKTINIGYGLDNNYCRCTATSIISFCKNNPNANFSFHLLVEDLSSQNKKSFRLLAKSLQTNIIIYEVNILSIKKLNLPITSSWTLPMYFRFILPLILSTENQLIYIDSDIICLNNAQELFELKLTDKDIIGAVAEHSSPDIIKRCHSLGLINHKYFNSGVLIINIPKWNKYNVFSKLISHIKETPHKFIYPDQDALNLILSNRVKYIDEKYNFLNYIYRDINKNHINFSNIILLHFAIHPKPWNIAWYLSPNCNKFNKDLYKSYEDLTPWKDTPLTYPNHCKEMKRYAKYLRWNKNYLKSFFWYFKYSIYKIIYIIKNI